MRRFISKEACIQACLGQQQGKWVPAPTCQVLKVSVEVWVQSHILCSTVHRYLKALSSEQPLGAGKASRTHIPRPGKGVGSPPVPVSSSLVNRQSCHLDDLPQEINQFVSISCFLLFLKKISF